MSKTLQNARNTLVGVFNHLSVPEYQYVSSKSHNAKVLLLNVLFNSEVSKA